MGVVLEKTTELTAPLKQADVEAIEARPDEKLLTLDSVTEHNIHRDLEQVDSGDSQSSLANEVKIKAENKTTKKGFFERLQESRETFVTLQILIGESIPAVVSGLMVNPKFAAEELFKESCKLSLRLLKKTTEKIISEFAAKICLPPELQKYHQVFLYWDDKDCLDVEAADKATTEHKKAIVKGLNRKIYDEIKDRKFSSKEVGNIMSYRARTASLISLFSSVSWGGIPVLNRFGFRKFVLKSDTFTGNNSATKEKDSSNFSPSQLISIFASMLIPPSLNAIKGMMEKINPSSFLSKQLNGVFGWRKGEIKPGGQMLNEMLIYYWERILSSQSWVEAAQSTMLLATTPLIYFGEKLTLIPLASMADKRIQKKYNLEHSILLKKPDEISSRGENPLINTLAKLQSLPLLRKPADINKLTKHNEQLNGESLFSNKAIFAAATFILNPLMLFMVKLANNKTTNELGKLKAQAA